MATNAPNHLYKNLKFSKLSEFSEVLNAPPHNPAWEPHVSHMEINMHVHCPLQLPKKVSKKLSINYIGSSMSHQLLEEVQKISKAARD